MASNVRFVYEDENDLGDHHVVEIAFEADLLDRYVEKFYWFLHFVGFNYIDRITVHKKHGDVIFSG